jgi:hypothetical protein
MSPRLDDSLVAHTSRQHLSISDRNGGTSSGRANEPVTSSAYLQAVLPLACTTLLNHRGIMPNAPGQSVYEPETQGFIKWIRSHSVHATLGPDPAHKIPFMPLPQLESYLKENNRTKRLLRALFPNSDPPIEPEEVWRSCIRVFSILLLIGKGSFIRHFVQHDQLCDSKLPFSSPPPHFPSEAGDDGFFDAFSRRQWHFYPHTFRRNVIDAQIEKESILPIVQKELLGDGGSALTYKIKIYPHYDDLMTPTDVRRV